MPEQTIGGFGPSEPIVTEVDEAGELGESVPHGAPGMADPTAPPDTIPDGDQGDVEPDESGGSIGETTVEDAPPVEGAAPSNGAEEQLTPAQKRARTKAMKKEAALAAAKAEAMAAKSQSPDALDSDGGTGAGSPAANDTPQIIVTPMGNSPAAPTLSKKTLAEMERGRQALAARAPKVG
jgi:hypothetical protein